MSLKLTFEGNKKGREAHARITLMSIIIFGGKKMPSGRRVFFPGVYFSPKNFRFNYSTESDY